MPATNNAVCMLLPMLVMVALTFVAFVHMAIRRTEAVKAGHDPAYYRAHIGTPEPEATTAAVRHYGNLLELPTLFYPACITAYALGEAGRWTLVFAWGYVAARVVQSLVHMTSNNTKQRGGAFVLGMIFMLALWINLGMAIIARA